MLGQSTAIRVMEAARGHPQAMPAPAAHATVNTLQWILRVAVAAEFIGHGAFGIMTKAAWVPYFAVWGFPEWLAWRMMPVVGTIDVTLGVLTLFAPIRAVLLYMAVWGFQTACLRPLSGEGIWELLERGYNYGVPFAFLLFAGFPSRLRDWVTPVERFVLTRARRRQMALALRVAIALALVGHGGIALFTHEKWVVYFGPLGLDPAGPAALSLLRAVGWFEIALGLAVLAAPVNALLLFVCLWKTGTEALRIPVGEPIWEFIERGGAYAAPLALLYLQGWPRSTGRRLRRSGPAALTAAACGALLALLPGAAAALVPAPAPAGTLSVVNDGPGAQADSDVKAEPGLVYQFDGSQNTIPYDDRATGGDAVIPNAGGEDDSLSDVGGTTIVSTRVGTQSAICAFEASTAGPPVELHQ